MSEFLLHYEPVPPTTWAYLSSLLMIGVFFKFSRFWSIRNFDLVLLILLGPGLLLVELGGERGTPVLSRPRLDVERAAVTESKADTEVVDARSSDVDEQTKPTSKEVAPPTETFEQPDRESADKMTGAAEIREEATAATRQESADLASTAALPRRGPSIKFMGFLSLLSVGVVILVRMLLDPTMVRRPLLEPNLSTGGLTFIGCSLFVFLMANVVISPTTRDDLQGPRSAEQLLAGVTDKASSEHLRRHGPGNAVLHLLPSFVTMPQHWSDTAEASEVRNVRTAKTTAILSHLAVVIGIIAIGYRHFDNIKMGIGAATLYLMLPYTAQMTGRVEHVLPAALLVWAVLCYRRPLAAGMFIGLAIGVVYYPLFLLPLWISFYWQRGLMRFVSGVFSTLVISVLSLVFISSDPVDFAHKVQDLFGIWLPQREGLQGVWGLGWDPIYRLPILAAFVAVSGALALWPAQKNLGTVLSCSAAVMLATQFWHGYGGGLYMAWYLPLVLLTIFRPNLEDRVALTVLGEGWFRRRRATLNGVEKAA